jgi:hypothetical protein
MGQSKERSRRQLKRTINYRSCSLIESFGNKHRRHKPWYKPSISTTSSPTTTPTHSSSPENQLHNPKMSQQPPTTQHAATATAASKWGITPNSNSSATKPIDPQTGKPIDWENFYDEETKKELRAKGVNPALKAEMEWCKSQSEGKGFWGKVAQTAGGGGLIR